jgi:hypothetical protein
MQIRGRHVTMLAILAVMLFMVGLWSAGAGFGHAGDDTPSTGRPTIGEVVATVVPLTAPSMDELRARADDVSPDGRQVRIGDVGISAAPVVSRAVLD